MISGESLLRVTTGILLVRYLGAGRLEMALIHHPPIFSPRTRHNTATAVKAGAAGGGPYVYAINIYITHYCSVYPEYSCVVSKYTPAPHTAVKAVTGITVAVIDTAVKTYVAGPITAVENINAVVKAPVAWGP